jgi:O-antigen/teichoic acid export membrane protein
MNRIQLIARNMGVLVLSQMISIILNFLYTLYVARYLGASGFGILSFALALTGIFVVFIDLGLNMLMVREVARNKSLARKYLGNIIVIKIFLALVTFLAIVLTVNLMKYSQETINVVYLIGLSVIFGSFSSIFTSIFQANEKMEYQSLSQILSSVLMFIGALIAIYYGLSLYALALLYFIVSTIILMYNTLTCFWKFVLPKLEINLDFWKYILLEALPFGLTSVFVVMYYYIDTVMLSIIIPNSTEIIGWYSAAYMLVIPLSFVPSVFFSSVFPAMSNFYKQSNESLKFTFQRSIRYMVILGVPIAAGITILANKIILLIYGSAYTPAITALQILIWSVPLIFVDSAYAYLLSSINRQITVTKIMGIVAFVNVVLNIILIPIFSYIGASMVMVVSDMITLMLFVLVLKNTSYKIPLASIKDILKVFLASAIMVFFILILRELNIFLIILFSSLVYVVAFLSFKGLDKDDIKIIKRIFSQKENN